jgi:diguanylate cyclase (GGDEF)-like protein
VENFSVEELQAYDRAHALGYFVGCTAALLEQNVEITEVIDLREDIIEELRETADYDYLTGLMIRRPFLDLIQKHFTATKRKSDQERIHSFLFLDLDNFKRINSRLGYDEGDACLKAAAESISSNMRHKDDFACRWGGEEFAIILGDTGHDGALAVAERIQKDINKVIPGGGTEQALGRLGVTIGIARFPQGFPFDPVRKAAYGVLLQSKDSSQKKNEIIFARQALPIDRT